MPVHQIASAAAISSHYIRLPDEAAAALPEIMKAHAPSVGGVQFARSDGQTVCGDVCGPVEL